MSRSAIPVIDRVGLIRKHFAYLTEADQLTLLSDLIQSHPLLDRSDGFIDALAPVDRAFDDAYRALSGLQPERSGRAGIFSRRAA